MLNIPAEQESQSYLHTLPTLFPVPGFDGHVIAPGENEGKGGMNCQASNVVRVRFEGGDFLVRIIVECAQLEVV